MMDFELLTADDASATPFQRLERFLRDRQRQLRALAAHPGHSLGFCLFLVVVLELVLSRRLSHSLGAGPDVLPQFAKTAVTLLFVEGTAAFVFHQGAKIFGKKGNPWILLTLFHWSELPLLLLLPMNVMGRLSGGVDGLMNLLTALLVFKVLVGWKESAEVVYGFTRRESLTVIYGSIAVLILAIVIFSTLSVMSLLTGLLSS